MKTHRIAALLLAACLSFSALADCVLRQSDAIELALGPYVDATDGVTAETGLTISQGDVILKKCAAAGDCGASAQKNDSSACAHDANGMYECDFNTTDTDTVGILEIWSFESGALPVFKTCEIVEEAVYDADYAASATGLRTANVTQFGGSNGTFASGRPEVNTTHWAGTAVGSTTVRADVINVGGSAVSATSGLLNANVTQVSGDTTAADNWEAILDLITNNGNGSFPPMGISASGTAVSYTAGTPEIVLAASTAAADNDFNDQLIIAWGDAGEIHAQCVADFTGASDSVILDAAFNTAPAGTIRYVIFSTPTCGAAAGGGATAQQVWEYATRALTILDEDSTTLDLNATTVGGVAVLDEDSTTIDLNASFVGGVTVFDEDSTTIDINATTLGTVTTATAVTTVNGLANNVLTAAAAAADLTTELQSGLATSTAVDDLPTNAELATSQAAADDATLAAIAALTDLTAAELRDVVIEDQGGGVSLGCALAVLLAYAAGDIATTGADTVYEDPSATETRIEGTVTAPGDRTAAITCPSY